MPQIETNIDDILLYSQNDEDHDHYLIRCLEKARKIEQRCCLNRKIKEVLVSKRCLVYYDVKKPVTGLKSNICVHRFSCM